MAKGSDSHTSVINQRIQRFRTSLGHGRPKAPALSKFNFRGWITFVTSMAAFGFSAVAFYNSITKEDDVRAIVTGTTTAIFYSDSKNPEGLEVFLTKPTLTIMNAGNRSAAISDASIRFIFEHPTGENPSYCSAITSAGVGFDNFAPFVVKANDISSVELNPKFSRLKDTFGFIELDPQLYSAKEDDIWVTTCLQLSLITPDKVLNEIRIPLSANKITKKASASTSAQLLPGLLKPVALYTKRQNSIW